MQNHEKFTVEIQKYAVINQRVILFDANLSHASVFNKDEIISSAGLACIWRKGSTRHIICCDENVSFSVMSKPEIDQKLIEEYLTATGNRN